MPHPGHMSLETDLVLCAGNNFTWAWRSSSLLRDSWQVTHQ